MMKLIMLDPLQPMIGGENVLSAFAIHQSVHERHRVLPVHFLTDHGQGQEAHLHLLADRPRCVLHEDNILRPLGGVKGKARYLLRRGEPAVVIGERGKPGETVTVT